MEKKILWNGNCKYNIKQLLNGGYYGSHFIINRNRSHGSD